MCGATEKLAYTYVVKSPIIVSGDISEFTLSLDLFWSVHAELWNIVLFFSKVCTLHCWFLCHFCSHSALRDLGGDFVIGFIQQMDAEKDPRNLLICFNCAQFICSNFSLGKSTNLVILICQSFQNLHENFSKPKSQVILTCDIVSFVYPVIRVSCFFFIVLWWFWVILSFSFFQVPSRRKCLKF